ncbi:MAG TPA: acetylornithine deacetylase [Ramlibacter sp.]|nr:acetylornithine deacetylase [Ramlibacter sp.]HVZ44111.1 acetylornithine deacetylase [Ramlibacter sp.]
MTSESASVGLLEQLVGFPTVSRDSNLALISFVADYLRGFGIASELFHNKERTKANLFATIGPGDRGGIVLSGHTDVVPVDGQNWSVDPFRLTRRDGRLYGRGTADMKGFIASVLATVPALAREDLAVPVHLAFSYDEEIGCVGVGSLLEELQTRANKPRLCLIGEPSELRPILGHKGKIAARCRVRGFACHSAHSPSGVNAIEYAARLIAQLGRIGERLAQPGLRDTRFDPPFSTVQTGLIKGGTALNIVPAECEFDFEVRAVPGFDPERVVAELRDHAATEVEPRMRAVQADTGVSVDVVASYPALATDAHSEAARLLADWSGSAEFGTVAFGSEGGLYDRAGIPAVVCGPGSMDQGHKPDEFITVDQLARCDAMLARLARYLRHA